MGDGADRLEYQEIRMQEELAKKKHPRDMLNSAQRRWFFTFGSNHIGGLDGYVMMENMTYDEARQLMIEMVGVKWCGQYTQKDWEEGTWGPNMKCIRVLTRDDLPGDLRWPALRKNKTLGELMER